MNSLACIASLCRPAKYTSEGGAWHYFRLSTKRVYNAIFFFRGCLITRRLIDTLNWSWRFFARWIQIQDVNWNLAKKIVRVIGFLSVWLDRNLYLGSVIAQHRFYSCAQHNVKRSRISIYFNGIMLYSTQIQYTFSKDSLLN